MRRFFPVLPVLTCLLAAGRAFPQEHGSVSASDGSHASTTIGSLTTVAQIRALSASESAQSHAVELHAVLTYYQPTQGQVFVQDATGGI